MESLQHAFELLDGPFDSYVSSDFTQVFVGGQFYKTRSANEFVLALLVSDEQLDVFRETLVDNRGGRRD